MLAALRSRFCGVSAGKKKRRIIFSESVSPCSGKNFEFCVLFLHRRRGQESVLDSYCPSLAVLVVPWWTSLTV